MATGTLYEGDGFLRGGPAYSARPIAQAVAKLVERKVTVSGDAESIEIEQRESKLRREYLPEWVCNLLES